MPTKCPIKQAAYKAKYYEKNKEEVKRKARIWTKKTRAYQRKLIARYKLMIGCKVCGYKKYDKALELHHTGGEKEKDVSNMIRKGVSIKTLKKEVRKCIVVCANCHRELHSKV